MIRTTLRAMLGIILPVGLVANLALLFAWLRMMSRASSF